MEFLLWLTWLAEPRPLLTAWCIPWASWFRFEGGGTLELVIGKLLCDDGWLYGNWP